MIRLTFYIVDCYIFDGEKKDFGGVACRFRVGAHSFEFRDC